jgi:hypothetical protein
LQGTRQELGGGVPVSGGAGGGDAYDMLGGDVKFDLALFGMFWIIAHIIDHFSCLKLLPIVTYC